MLNRKSGKTGPLGATIETSQLFRVLARANQIASSTELDELLSEMLDLIILICGANAGTLYLLDQATDELIFKVVKGDEASQKLLGRRINSQTGITGATVHQNTPVVVEDLAKDSRWYRPLGEVQEQKLHNVISLPLLLRDKPIGVVQVFNFTHSPLQFVQLLGNRMASEIEKAMLLQASQQRGERLEALVSIIREISSTLDRDQILNMIIDYARELLDAEASSLFLLDEKTGDLILHISRDMHQTKLPLIRVPAGEGVIGHVVRTGEVVLVTDAAHDDRVFRGLNHASGVVTRSILAVPLRTPTVVLGQECGTTEECTIGGLEAINKREGTFNENDAQLLRTLADQAATVLHIAKLYADANELFWDTSKALVAAIDAKDPYTEGHSQRVSDFSVAIARELDLSNEMIHHIRIGSLLHDVGKIGVPDAILKKPGKLTSEEFDTMKKHPSIGANIMGNVRMLHTELHALAEHHERLDGGGYPNTLSGNEISLIGRIVAVADAFDAMASDRPYRQALDVKNVLDKLYAETGLHYDVRCVNALVQAYRKGRIRTQKERE